MSAMIMPNAPPILFRWADIDLDKVTEMVSRKEIQCDGESLVQTYLKKGALVPIHAHGGHQMGLRSAGRVAR